MATSEAELLAAVRAAFAEEAVELLRRAEAALTALRGAAPGAHREPALAALRALHTLKGSASSVGAAELVGLVHALEERLRALEAAPAAGHAEADAQLSSLEELRAALRRHLEPAAPGPGRAPAPADLEGAADLLRIRPERVDALHTLAGELVVTRLQFDGFAERLAELRDLAEDALSGHRRVAAQLERLRERLPEAARQELSQALQALAGGSTSLHRDLGGLARAAAVLRAQSSAVSARLEDGIRDLRLMPLQPFFEEYGRVVREAARHSGKEARLELRAEGAELDRAVLVQLREPLLHLVQNAVVHGLEAPAARRAAGKPAEGVVRLEARVEGARAVLRVVDDGHGVDAARVQAKAAAQGLLGEQPGALGPDELLELLCRPGFSTRESADGLAGRGIGLDVVATRVRALDGQLRLESAPGRGTTFTIDVPVSASTGVGLVVSTAGQSFAVLLHSVERVARLARSELAEVAGKPTARLGGEAVGVAELGPLLGLAAPEAGEERRPAVVLRQGRARLALLVDEVPGEQTLVVKPLGRAFAGSRLVRGGAVQADGSILPVLEVPELFSRAGRATAAPAARPAAPAPARSRRNVLVVDDSLTMRTLLRNLLQAASCAVTLAHDGRSGLEAYEAGAYDLVISDLQMPRLDGVALCRAVRASGRPATPFLMVTSVGDAQERQRALEAGADAYLVKSEFEQGHFLELVSRLASPGRA